MQYKNIKKGFDYLFLIIISPILIILIAFFSLLIKIFNPKESVFFIQDRVGYNGKIFKMIKFRTMYSSSKNNLFTSEDDARIDNLGVFLRRFRIDELPQFINILAGQMSLIGPRPEQVHFVKVLTEKYGERFNIRHDGSYTPIDVDDFKRGDFWFCTYDDSNKFDRLKKCVPGLRAPAEF